ncbi:hypothetical protein C0991_001460 [Blastosporella zonata]|nr:hypothetical protein C0991_001460 [Blastosporella zonata]
MDFIDLYTSPTYGHTDFTNKPLEAAMRTEIEKWAIPRGLDKTIHIAASLIEVAFHQSTFEEKRLIALYNWYILYVDDLASENIAPVAAFQHRFTCSLPQIDPLLDGLAIVLREIVESYPTLQANMVLSTTFEFFTAACLEPQLASEPPVGGAESTRFPLFLRERIGIGLNAALMLFSPSLAPHFVYCYRALPDMAYWITATNDILSFYKEQRAGEAGYIHTRAAAERRTLSDMLECLKAEVSVASKSVKHTLAGDPAAVDTWRKFENGVV